MHKILNPTGTKNINGRSNRNLEELTGMKANPGTLLAGAAAVNITPENAQRLAGYPFVKRMSTGVHDPLLSSALFLTDGRTPLLMIANDLLYVGKASVMRVRQRISVRTGIPGKNIMISATHTHSGPFTVRFTAGGHDPLTGSPDEAYIRFMEDGLVQAGCEAFLQAAPAQLGLAVADATGIGTNRHDPAGPADLQVPVLLVRTLENREPLACMCICNMHPTVLHEDSTLFSGDFPGIARQIIQREILKTNCPVLYHIGTAGNQSPRHVTKENSFAEAERLGNMLAQAVGRAIDEISFISALTIAVRQQFIELPKRVFPPVPEAKTHLEKCAAQLKRLKEKGRSRQEIRTAEVDWFGAMESLYLAKRAQEKTLDEVYRGCLPAETEVFQVGPWSFLAWPGEIFIEYGQEIKRRYENVFPITLANGELQGYIVTKEAAAQGVYEASNAIFDYRSGKALVAAAMNLLKD